MELKGLKVLAIDTASIVATAAIMDQHKLLGECILNHDKTHSQKMMPMIQQLFKSTELTPKDIDVFAASNGPGSFTGLRIGVATIKGFAHALNKPVVGISTLDGLAYNLAFCNHTICPIMDARREQVYNAVYRWENDKLHRLTPHRALSIEALVDELMQTEQKVIFTGDGVPVFYEYLKEKLQKQCDFAPIAMRMQRASSIAALAMQKALVGEVEGYMTFSPFYLRKSQAEREYEKKLKALTE